MSARTLSTYALCSAAEAKRAAGVSTTDALGDDVADMLSDCIEAASREIERLAGRQFVTRGSLTRYHSMNSNEPSILRLRESPIIAITSVQEGYWEATGWTVSETLAITEDYLSESSDEVAILRRVSTGAETSWPSGPQTVKVVYSAGYATTAAVPVELRLMAAKIAARRFAELRRGQPGAQSVSDGMGSVTRYLPGQLLSLDIEMLRQFCRYATTEAA